MYFGSEDMVVYSIDGAGKQRWVFNASSGVYASPAVAGGSSQGAAGTVYVGSDGGSVFELDAQTGAMAWEFKTGGAVYSTPALQFCSRRKSNRSSSSRSSSDHPCAIFFGSSDGTMYSLDLASF